VRFRSTHRGTVPPPGIRPPQKQVIGGYLDYHLERIIANTTTIRKPMRMTRSTLKTQLFRRPSGVIFGLTFTMSSTQSPACQMTDGTCRLEKLFGVHPKQLLLKECGLQDPTHRPDGVGDAR